MPKKKAHKHIHQTQTQNVYINTHRQQRAQSSVPRNNHSTISTPIIVPFVQPLPPGHPFNTNAPQNQSGVSANVPVNQSVPQPSALATHVGAAPPPQTPHATPHTSYDTPQTPVPKQKQKRGKNLLISNAQDGSVDLPKLADLDDNLGGLATKTLNAILDNEFEDSDKLINKKSDRRNKKRVESAAKKARDQKMREMLDMY